MIKWPVSSESLDMAFISACLPSLRARCFLSAADAEVIFLDLLNIMEIIDINI